MRPLIVATATAAALALSGCVQTSPNVYEPYAVGQVAYTEMGVVASARTVEIAGPPGGTGIGATVGAVAGGIAGAQIGPSSYSHYGHRHRYLSAGSALGALGGAVVGGLLGAAFEHEVTRQQATEYIVRMDDGSMVTIVQGAAPIPVGQRVFLQTAERGRARLVPAA